MCVSGLWRMVMLGCIACGLFWSASLSLTHASTLNCATANNINVGTGECQALIDLYDDTNGQNRFNNTNRDTDTNVCSWYGITCANFFGQDRVIKVGPYANGGSLSTNNLSGNLPASLSLLTKLEEFDISFNPFVSGTLPSGWSSWGPTIKKFNVQGNSLVGPLPTAWSNWSVIEEFNVSFNPLNTHLPVSWNVWGGHIKKFFATQAQLTGTLPVSWSSWGSSIEHFGVNINNLVGTLPVSWSSRGGSIKNFSVLQNNLTGTLPVSWSSRGGSIENFLVNNNSIGGILPSSWSSRGSSIRVFEPFNNQIQGYLPSSWSSWGLIDRFAVHNNKLIGSIPSSWGSNRPDIPSFGTYANFADNCLNATSYSSGMLSWITNNAHIFPQYNSPFCNFTVTYHATSGGNISGNANQTIPFGGNATTVAAVPSSGCVFVERSDGSLTNPRTDTAIANTLSLTASFLCNTLPTNASGVVVPAVAFWYGKVNQYFDIASMTWKTDPTGMRGGGSWSQWGRQQGRGDRRLAYCKFFYPATIAAQSIGVVTIHTWMRQGNIMPRYTGTTKAYECVQSVGQSSLPSPNRSISPSIIIPTKKDILPPIESIVTPLAPTVLPSFTPVDHEKKKSDQLNVLTPVLPVVQPSPIIVEQHVRPVTAPIDSIIQDQRDPLITTDQAPSLNTIVLPVPKEGVAPSLKEKKTPTALSDVPLSGSKVPSSTRSGGK